MFVVISDTHCHNWSMFSSTNENGVNSRLQIILDEIERATSNLKEGDWLFHAGDLFHVRGNLAPSVLNPTLACFKKLTGRGIKVVIVCGNHDSEFRSATWVGSAIDSFREIGCEVVNEAPKLFKVSEKRRVACIPWIPSKDEWLKVVQSVRVQEGEMFDIVAHVALDGVFSRIDGSSCVDPNDLKNRLKDNGFDRIFAGHLHKKKMITPFAWSVGSIAQHNWGDINSEVGHLEVYDDHVDSFDSEAPKFVELYGDESDDEFYGRIKNNYVRLIGYFDSEKDIKATRKMLEKHGAKGVTVIAHHKEVVRDNSIQVEQEGGLPSIERLIFKYTPTVIDEKIADKVRDECLCIMQRVKVE